MSPADPASDYRTIENLIAAYAELVDAGDFAAVAELLADATFTGGAGSVSGRDAIERMLQQNVIIYDDGTPRTKHVTTNVSIDVDDQAGTAVSRSYFTVFQALLDLPLQPIASGRYHDRFELRPERIAALLLETAPATTARPEVPDSLPAGIAVSDASGALLDATGRLLALLDAPDDAAALAAGVEREVLWRLLTGPRGRPCGRSGSPTAGSRTWRARSAGSASTTTRRCESSSSPGSRR